LHKWKTSLSHNNVSLLEETQSVFKKLYLNMYLTNIVAFQLFYQPSCVFLGYNSAPDKWEATSMDHPLGSDLESSIWTLPNPSFLQLFLICELGWTKCLSSLSPSPKDRGKQYSYGSRVTLSKEIIK
jgi:hypothetical protein